MFIRTTTAIWRLGMFCWCLMLWSVDRSTLNPASSARPSRMPLSRASHPCSTDASTSCRDDFITRVQPIPVPSRLYSSRLPARSRESVDVRFQPNHGLWMKAGRHERTRAVRDRIRAWTRSRRPRGVLLCPPISSWRRRLCWPLLWDYISV